VAAGRLGLSSRGGNKGPSGDQTPRAFFSTTDEATNVRPEELEKDE
jgi:hypothetical protein